MPPKKDGAILRNLSLLPGPFISLRSDDSESRGPPPGHHDDGRRVRTEPRPLDIGLMAGASGNGLRRRQWRLTLDVHIFELN
jgi:hypothetical protein